MKPQINLKSIAAGFAALNQTHHANSPCFQAFTRAFPDEAEPKWQLKQARAVLEQEAAVVEEVSA
jgi:hypothetical protein